MDTVAQFCEIDRQIKDLEAKKKALAAEILANGITDSRIRVKSRKMLNADRLKATISTSLWTAVTKRVPVATLVKAAVIKDQMDQNVLNTCYDTSAEWIERV